MFLKTLELENLSVTYSDELNLSVSPSLTFSSEHNSLETIAGHEFIEAIRSKFIWVTRSLQCGLTIKVSVGGKQLPLPLSSHILEHLQDVIKRQNLHCQMNLVPAASDLLIEGHNHSKLGLSFLIKPLISESELDLEAMLNLEVPDLVKTVRVERIELEFTFCSKPSTQSSLPKKIKTTKTLHKGRERTELTLKKENRNLYLENLEGTAKRMCTGFSNLIRSRFDGILSDSDSQDSLSGNYPHCEDGMLLPSPNLSQPKDVHWDFENAEDVICIPPSILENLEISCIPDRAPPLCDYLSLDMSKASGLTRAAFQILIGGYNSRFPGNLKGLQVSKPYPALPLCEIAPGIFSPGFNKAIAGNARFLPIISHGIATSWIRNVQSPSLRHKLEHLADMTLDYPPMKPPRERDSISSESLEAKLNAVIWGMMQRKLYSPSAARQAFQTRKSDTSRTTYDEDEILLPLHNDYLYEEEEEEDEMLDFETDTDWCDSDIDLFEDGMHDADVNEAIFTDLLASDNDGEVELQLLDPWTGERVAVELFGTDEMLLGLEYHGDAGLEVGHHDDPDMLLL